MIGRLLTILFLSILALQGNTTGISDPTILCPSLCSKFTTNSNIFSDEVQMAKNLSNVVLNANSPLEVIKTFGNYTQAYKLKTVQSLMGFKLLQDYEYRLKEKYGEEAVTQYIDQRYPGSACEPCQDNVASYAESIGVSWNLLDEETIADSLDEEVYKPLILLPFSKYPNIQNPYRRLLQPQYPPDECLDESEGRLQEFSCVNQLQTTFKQMFLGKYKFDPYSTNITKNNIEEGQAHLKIESDFAGDNVKGLAQMILSKKYRQTILNSYFNCNLGIYAATCN